MIYPDTLARACAELDITGECAHRASLPTLRVYWTQRHDEIQSALETDDEAAVRVALDMPALDDWSEDPESALHRLDSLKDLLAEYTGGRHAWENTNIGHRLRCEYLWAHQWCINPEDRMLVWAQFERLTEIKRYGRAS